MGRKQKLRQEKKRNIKNKAAATAEVTAAAAAANAAVATTFSTENAIVETAEEKKLALEKALAREIENQLPKSDKFVQAMADLDNISGGEQFKLLKQGVMEHECVHSMLNLGYRTMNTKVEKSMYFMGVMLPRGHFALPWYLEGAIRGSIQSVICLIANFYNRKAGSNRKVHAFHCYWGEILKKYFSFSGNALMEHKDVKDLVERECAICSKTDTKTLTLKQCSGCSVYCYCSEECQTKHWEEHKHRNECKQVHILNKYHKPYAKEIRDAVIRGDKEIPSLEKLRYKLGLTRPRELKPTHNGIPIDPDDYLVGREDGKVWVGSTPRSPIRTS